MDETAKRESEGRAVADKPAEKIEPHYPVVNAFPTFLRDTSFVSLIVRHRTHR